MCFDLNKLFIDHKLLEDRQPDGWIWINSLTPLFAPHAWGQNLRIGEKKGGRETEKRKWGEVREIK